MIIDCLFFIVPILFKFSYSYALYSFILFLIVFYLDTKIKNKTFIIIQIISLLILLLVAFDNIIINSLYDIWYSGKVIFYYKNYLYQFSLYFISGSMFYLYLKQKKYESYLLLIPFIAFNIKILIVMLIVLLLKSDYYKLVSNIKKDFSYLIGGLGIIYAILTILQLENKFILLILIFSITYLIMIYNNFKITKIINLFILETILLFPIYFEAVYYIFFIMMVLVFYKIYNNGFKYLIPLKHSIFISFIIIGLILITSFYIHYQNININSDNTFLFTIFKTPIFAYIYYIFGVLFFGVFLLEAKKVIYKKMINVFILSIFVSEIFSYMIIFDIKPILNIFLENYYKCDPAPFTNHILYSFFISLMLVFLIDIFLKSNSKYKYFLLLFIVTATLNLFLNGGRTGQLSFILGVLIYFWFYFENIKKFILLSISLFFIIFIIINIPTKCKNNSRLQEGNKALKEIVIQNNYNSSWGIRLAMDISTIQYMLYNPKDLVLGIGGLKDKRKLMSFTSYNNKNISKAIYICKNALSHLHNAFMQLLLDGGIIPFLLFLYIFYYLAKLKTSNEALKYSLLAVIFVFVNQGVVLFYPQEFMSFLFVIIVIWNLRRKNDICINSHIQ